MFPYYKGKPAAIFLRWLQCISIIHCQKLHPRFSNKFLDLLQRIGSLIVNLLILLIKSVLSWNKQSQLICINPGLLIITVLPDKASLIPVLSNRTYSRS